MPGPFRRVGGAAPVIGLVVILLGWEWWPRVADIPPYLLPRPSDVLGSVLENRDTLLRATWLTVVTSVTGLVLAILLGVGGAVLMSMSTNLERTLFPYAIVVQTTPTVMIAPLAVIWIGPGFWAIVAVSVFICFFPMLSNTLVGLNSVDPDMRSLFRLYGASKLETTRKLRLPGSLPFIMAGVRIAGGLSVIGALIGEFVVGAGGPEGGLGALVQQSAEQMKTSLLVSASLAGGCLGIAYYLVTKQLSNRLLGWHESATSRATPVGAR